MSYRILSLIILFCASITLNAQAQTMTWTQVQGPWGGNINKITSHSNGTVYASRYDGVFYSTNEGINWQKMSEGNVANVNTIKMAPNGTLYIGKSSGGLWWTANNGASWNFNSIHVAPHSGTWASVITLGINSSSHIYIQSERSFNGGITFNDHFQISNQLARDYEFDGSSVIYAATNLGVYQSTNGGGTWNNVSTSMPNANTCIQVRTNSGGDIFAGTSENGIFFSSNNGVSWAARNTGLNDLNITSIEIDNTGKLYAGTKNGLFVSINNGASWTAANPGIAHPWIQTMHIVSDNKIFAGTQRSGVFFSSNGGQSWAERNNGMKLHNLSDVEFIGNDEIFLGSAYGMYYSNDNGVTWEDRSGIIPGGSIYVMGKDNNNTIYAGTFGNGIYKTSNNGLTWNAINTGLPANSRIKAIEIMPDNSLVLLKEGSSTFDTLKIYKSTNGGSEWNEIFRGDGGIFNTNFGVDNQGNIYLSGMTVFIEGVLIKSTNGGSTFEEINTGNIEHDYFTVAGTDIYSITYDKIYKSTNQGTNWDQLPTGPWGNNRVGPMAVSSDGDLLLGGNGGVFYSTNTGTSWTASNTGLASPLGLKGMAFDNKSFAYLYTYEEGLYKSDNVTTLLTNQNVIPDRYSLSQNYPNPFNPSTQIKFDIPKGSNVSLIVYNSLGQEAARLVSAGLEAGSYTYNFDASGYSSGIYFYRLSATSEAGEYSETKRMVFIK